MIKRDRNGPSTSRPEPAPNSPFARPPRWQPPIPEYDMKGLGPGDPHEEQGWVPETALIGPVCATCGRSLYRGDCLYCGPYGCEVCDFTGNLPEFEKHLQEFAHSATEGIGMRQLEEVPAELREILQQVYTDEDMLIWWRSSHQLLEGLPPFVKWQTDPDAVLAVAERLLGQVAT